MMKKSKKKMKVGLIDPDSKPFIVMNEHLQVWTGLRNGGLELVFSNNFDDAKSLEFEAQFRCLKHIYYYKLEQIYL